MSKNIKWIIGVGILLVVVIVSNLETKPSGPIKIGIATILSGDYAAAGTNMVNATKLAIKQINDSGGINGRQLELTIEDSGCASKEGLSAAQKLINVDGIKYIVGGMCSNGTLAAAPLANDKKVLIMTPVTGGKNIDDAGDYIFRNANSDILAGRDLANAMLKLGYKNVSVISEVTEYTLDIQKTFIKTIQDGGGTIVSSEEFQPDTKDFRTQIGKIQATHPQALLVLSQLGTNAAQFIKQSRQLGFNPALFTDFTLATNGNAKKIVGSFDGIYFADPAYAADDPATKSFFDLYQKTYGITSLVPFHAAASYDVVMMYADAIKAVGDNPVKVKEWLLSNVKNRHGLMGTFSFDANGNSDLGFVIKLFKNGKPEAVKF